MLALDEGDCFAQLSSVMLHHLKRSAAVISLALAGRKQSEVLWSALSMVALAKAGIMC